MEDTVVGKPKIKPLKRHTQIVLTEEADRALQIVYAFGLEGGFFESKSEAICYTLIRRAAELRSKIR